MSEEYVGKVIDAANTVNYQDGSVVSKTLIDKGVGTVTLFAFAEGQGLSEHISPYDAMVQVIDGSGSITIDGEEITVNTGEMIIMPAMKPHALMAKVPFKMILTMIRPPKE